MVQFTSVVTALVAGLVATTEAQGGCYNSGLGFPNKDTAYWHANRACYGYDGNRGAFQDVYFRPWNESPYPASVCVNAGDNWHLIMEWRNTFNSGVTLTPSLCWESLKTVIDLCWGGGEFTTYADGGYRWKYRVDPNSGYC